MFVSGCRFGDCHYLYGNYSANRRIELMRELLAFCGIEGDRLRAHWGSSAEAPELVHAVKEYIELLRELGPSPLRKDGKGSGASLAATG